MQEWHAQECTGHLAYPSCAILTDATIPPWCIEKITESDSGLLLYDRRDFVEETRSTENAWRWCRHCRGGSATDPARDWQTIGSDDHEENTLAAEVERPNAQITLKDFAQLRHPTER